MEALYWRPPEAEECAVLGFTPDDYPPPVVELWPENWPAIELFTQVNTQWRAGPSGVIGLDYGVVFHELDRKGLPAGEYDEMMAAIRVIERMALDKLHDR